jgi:hypothetical protein
MNLEMLLDLGGRERTEPEYRRFLSQAGFELTRVVQTASPVSLVESKPTWVPSRSRNGWGSSPNLASTRALSPFARPGWLR